MAEDKKVRAVKMSEKYHLIKGDRYSMDVEVIKGTRPTDKRLRITNHQSNNNEFIFNPSKPETVRAIAELLLRASSL